MLKKVKIRLTKAIFPSRCAYCGEVIPADETACSACRKKLKLIGESCLNCGCAKGDCRCSKKGHYYEAVTAPFYYDGLPEKAVKALKFSNRTYAVDEMARQIAKKVKEEFSGITFDYVTGVPMFWKRKQERGFNQSDMIAKQVGDRLQIPFHPKLIRKIFDTQPQHDLPEGRRAGNMVGAFDVPLPDLAAGETILLIDDVFTTGATLNECSRTLKAYNAENIYCAAFAVTKRKQGKGVNNS